MKEINHDESRHFTYADLTYLESMSDGNSEIMEELISIFLDQVPEFTNGLREHLANGEWFALGALAHKAKSSVAVMGMDALSADLKTLEISAKAGVDPETYPVLVGRFVDQVTLTASELRRYLDSRG